MVGLAWTSWLWPGRQAHGETRQLSYRNRVVKMELGLEEFPEEGKSAGQAK